MVIGRASLLAAWFLLPRFHCLDFPVFSPTPPRRLMCSLRMSPCVFIGSCAQAGTRQHCQAGAQSGSVSPKLWGAVLAKPTAEQRKVTRTVEVLFLLTLCLSRAKGIHGGCLEPVRGFTLFLPSPWQERALRCSVPGEQVSKDCLLSRPAPGSCWRLELSYKILRLPLLSG